MRIERSSNSICANDRSDTGDLCDDDELDIVIRDELIYSMRSV